MGQSTSTHTSPNSNHTATPTPYKQHKQLIQHYINKQNEQKKEKSRPRAHTDVLHHYEADPDPEGDPSSPGLVPPIQLPQRASCASSSKPQPYKHSSRVPAQYASGSAMHLPASPTQLTRCSLTYDSPVSTSVAYTEFPKNHSHSSLVSIAKSASYASVSALETMGLAGNGGKSGPLVAAINTCIEARTELARKLNIAKKENLAKEKQLKQIQQIVQRMMPGGAAQSARILRSHSAVNTASLSEPAGSGFNRNFSSASMISEGDVENDNDSQCQHGNENEWDFAKQRRETTANIDSSLEKCETARLDSNGEVGTAEPVPTPKSNLSVAVESVLLNPPINYETFEFNSIQDVEEAALHLANLNTYYSNLIESQQKYGCMLDKQLNEARSRHQGMRLRYKHMTALVRSGCKVTEFTDHCRNMQRHAGRTRGKTEIMDDDESSGKRFSRTDSAPAMSLLAPCTPTSL